MTARHTSICTECRNPIEAGSEITKRNGRWVHRTCPAPAADRQQQVGQWSQAEDRRRYASTGDTRPATPRQVRFCAHLARQLPSRVTGPIRDQFAPRDASSLEPLSRSEISTLIDAYQAAIEAGERASIGGVETPAAQRGSRQVEDLTPTRNVREATMLANGRLDATIIRPDGQHITLFLKARTRNEGAGRRWIRANFADATHVFISAGKDGDTVATFYPPRGEFRAQGDPARAAAAEELIRYLAEKGELNGGVISANACGRCGRRLTDPTSIHRGIGPECYGQATGSQHVPLLHEPSQEALEMAADALVTPAPEASLRQARANDVREAEARRSERLMQDIEANADRQQTIRDETRRWAHDMAVEGDDLFEDALGDVDRAAAAGTALAIIVDGIREDELLADDIKSAAVEYAKAVCKLRNLGAR